MIPDIKECWETIAIKTLWYLDKNGHICQWNRIKSLEINTQMYSQVIFDEKCIR